MHAKAGDGIEEPLDGQRVATREGRPAQLILDFEDGHAVERGLAQHDFVAALEEGEDEAVAVAADSLCHEAHGSDGSAIDVG